MVTTVNPLFYYVLTTKLLRLLIKSNIKIKIKYICFYPL